MAWHASIPSIIPKRNKLLSFLVSCCDPPARACVHGNEPMGRDSYIVWYGIVRDGAGRGGTGWEWDGNPWVFLLTHPQRRAYMGTNQWDVGRVSHKYGMVRDGMGMGRESLARGTTAPTAAIRFNSNARSSQHGFLPLIPKAYLLLNNTSKYILRRGGRS